MSFKVTKTEPRGSAKAKKIASSISVVDAKGSVTYTDAAGRVSHVDLSATNSYVDLRSAIGSRYISPSAITLGYYLLKHEAFDLFTALDIATFTFSKSLFDEVAITEDVVKFFHGKGHTDTAFISTVLDLGLQKHVAPDFASFDDSISYRVDFKRTFNETPEFSDYQVFATSKYLNDIAVSSERLARAIGTTKEDLFSLVDAISLESGKVFGDAFGATDATSLEPSKVFGDATEFTDVQRFDIGRSIADFINVTDDFLGASNIDDDQTMHFGKTLIDNGSASESLSRLVNYARVFSDAGSTADVTSLAPNKIVDDVATLGDVFSRTLVYERELDDSGYLSTQFSASISKPLQDNGTAAETAVKSVGSNSSDSASVTDSGALFWQDYVEDPSYFGEDYVGNRQLF
jgi:hypothetical protein